jgi:hypothetical protein
MTLGKGRPRIELYWNGSPPGLPVVHFLRLLPFYVNGLHSSAAPHKLSPGCSHTNGANQALVQSRRLISLPPSTIHLADHG